MRRVAVCLVSLVGSTIVLGGVALAELQQPGQAQPAAQAQQPAAAPKAQAFTLLADRLVWEPAPKELPAGAEMTVLSGDPSQPGPFAIRFRVPGEYQVPAHWHPGDEMVTIISGTFHLGMGDKFDETQGTPLVAGDFALIPADVPHYGWASEATVLQIQGQGPWAMRFVEPSDSRRAEADQAPGASTPSSY